MIAIERVKSSFDIVFADPPYEYKKHRDLSERILSNHLIAPGGWFIIEHPANIVMNDLPNYFETRKYGKVHFSFFSSPNKSES
jgi:16S rRNA G966 N2-methylase RsmD